MKKWILPLLISMPSFAGVSLKDAYTKAKENMETIKRANAQLNQAEAEKMLLEQLFYQQFLLKRQILALINLPQQGSIGPLFLPVSILQL